MQFQTSPIRHVGNRLTCADFKQFAGMFAAILSGKRSRWYPGTYGNFYSIQASRQKRIIECDPNVDLYAFCDISKKRCAFLLTLAEHLLRMFAREAPDHHAGASRAEFIYGPSELRWKQLTGRS